MSDNLTHKAAKKRRPSFVYAIMSITMVLLLLGLLSIMFFYTQKAITKVQESIELEVILKEEVKETDIVQLRSYLDTAAYVKQQEFVSKEEAAKNYSKEIGQDFVEALGFNPLYDAFVLRLNARYSNVDSITMIKERLMKQAGVEDISYSKAAVELVSARMKTIAYVVLGISAVLLLIAFSLIDSTIRLLMFSQRFIIRSMQLIGATRNFIMKPYLLRGLFTGFISAVITIFVIGVLLFYIENRFHIGLEDRDTMLLAGIGLGLMLTGMVISTFSTFLAVSKYLKMKLDDLY